MFSCRCCFWLSFFEGFSCLVAGVCLLASVGCCFAVFCWLLLVFAGCCSCLRGVVVVVLLVFFAVFFWLLLGVFGWCLLFFYSWGWFVRAVLFYCWFLPGVFYIFLVWAGGSCVMFSLVCAGVVVMFFLGCCLRCLYVYCWFLFGFKDLWLLFWSFLCF